MAVVNAFEIITFENIEPDVRVITIANESDLERFIISYLGLNPISLIVANLDPVTRPFCPYLRILTSEVSPDYPENHKLQTFLSKIRSTSLFPRCRRAVAVGLASCVGSGGQCLPMPTAFYITSVPVIELGINGEIDMSCLVPVGPFQGHELKDIQGVLLPCHLPISCQDLILRFLREPTAQLIVDAMDGICADFDRVVFPMFRQAWCRIPPNLAYFFNAPTVRSTISVATKPYLVPAALGRTRTASPNPRRD